MTQAIQSTSAVQIVHATNANIYTAAKDSARKDVLIMTEYIENPLSGKLRGVTYEDGKIIDVHIRDTDDVVKVFIPVRHGRWTDKGEYAVCTECGGRSGTQYDGVEPIPLMTQFCPNCGCRMDGGAE